MTNPKTTILFLMFIFFATAFFSGCREDRQIRELARIIQEWQGKEILFPDNIVFTIHGRDTVAYEIPASPHKIVVYIDSVGCMSCRFHFDRWNNGRLFMWKITTLAIAEAPITGVGLGGFPAAYAEAQMSYFRSGRGTATERLVAGSPEYAFNEYLRIFLEQGILGGVPFLLLIFFILKKGIKNRQIGAAGSFLALSVFAFASYPFYLWEFLVAWVLLATICVSQKNANGANLRKKISHANLDNSDFSTKKICENLRSKKIYAVLFLCALLTTSFFVAQHQKTYREAHQAWEHLRPLYSMRAFERIVDDYERLFPMLNHNPRFVFEYAMILNATEQREEAADVLRRGLQISNDPMFFNVMGRNYHEMGEFDRAEAAFLNSTHLLPHRIYPFYLLTLLYADSANFQPERMKWAARMVLEKEPKVHSTAIDEMRAEVREVLLNMDER